MKQRQITDHMDASQGRAVSSAQTVGVAKWNAITKKIGEMREQVKILNKCGLDKEAKAFVKAINELEWKRKELEDELNEERREMAKSLLLCLAACDVTTTVADMFADVMHKLTKGVYKEDNALSQQIREQADSFNKIVQAVDVGNDFKLSMLYADMAEKIGEAVIPVMQQIIGDYCNSPQGRKSF